MYINIIMRLEMYKLFCDKINGRKNKFDLKKIDARGDCPPIGLPFTIQKY